MKKNLIYLLLLVGLAVVAYFALRKEKRTFSEDDANFQVTNVEDVTKIFLSDPSEENIKLSKTEDGTWMVNDSFRARQDWVAFLLDGLEKQNASQMVPQSMHNSTIKLLAGSSIKVEVYKGDKKSNSFYVAKEPGKDNLTVMLNIREDGTNASRPFLVKYGYTNNFLGVRYKTEIENWRDKRILFFPKDEMAKIEVRYPKKTSANYSLNLQPTLSILPSSDSSGNKVNKSRMKTYISFYENIFCTGFENDYILKDTFLNTFEPFAQVRVSNKNGDEQSLDLYYRQVTKGTHSVLKINGEEYDGDSFFGHLNKQDLVLVSTSTAQKILREHQEFFVSDSAPK